MLIGNQSHTDNSDKDLWATPWDIFYGVERLFSRKFDLDACASLHNAKCVRYITEEQNCLTTDWGETTLNVWMNPPYSNPKLFIERVIEQVQQHGHFVVMLLPADTSVEWFELCLLNAAEIWFITAGNGKGGRLQFLHNADGKAKSGNSKGSMLVVFRPMAKGIHYAKTRYVAREALILLSEEKENGNVKT